MKEDHSSSVHRGRRDKDIPQHTGCHCFDTVFDNQGSLLRVRRPQERSKSIE
jgi:hypothetical protein